MNDGAMSKLKNMDNIESLLFQVEGSNFTNFEAMEEYLETAEKTLDSRLRELGDKMEGVGEQLKRTAGVYQFNNKKRLKEEEYLEMQRQKLKKKMEDHQSKINLTVHPITLVLKQKRSEIQRLAQTKEIVQDFNKIMAGKQDDLAKVLPLDQRNFNASALKVYVFKCLLDEMGHEKYQLARLFIRKKFLELKTRILSNFKEGFLKKDIIMLNNILPYCEEYELMQEVSDYYNQQAFKQSHPLQKIEREMITPEIQNFFFLLKRGFHYAFSTTVNGNEKNGYKINVILSKYSDLISRRLISIVFQKFVKESIDSILKSFQQSSDYLQALQLLYSECKAMLKECEGLIQQDKLVHLMQTYMESIFDIYLENYINKELHSLGRSYQESIGLVIEQMRAIDALQEQDQVRKDNKKFSFKKLMDYKIETKKQYNPVYVKSKLQALSSVFMDPALQQIFEVTKYALIRNNKISKLNEMYNRFNSGIKIEIKSFPYS